MATFREIPGGVVAVVVAGILSTWTQGADGVELPFDGPISYVNGGIGREEADALRAQARDYPLELVFIRRVGNREEFLADVHLTIVDAAGRVTLDRPAQGPIFLARLPDGPYTLTADYNGERLVRRVTVGGQRHEKVSLVWS